MGLHRTAHYQQGYNSSTILLQFSFMLIQAIPDNQNQYLFHMNDLPIELQVADARS